MSHKIFRIPEIVYHIASFLPLWKLNAFYPQDLVAFVKVNRLWHATLTPLLWKSHGKGRIGQWQIPQHVIDAFGHHIQYLQAYSMSQIAWPMTNLKSLSNITMENGPAALDFLAAHPTLTRLVWYGADGLIHYPKMEERTDIVKRTLTILQSFSRLVHLTLSHWSFDSSTDATLDLISILRNNPQLQSLQLIDLTDLARFDVSPPQLLNLTSLSLSLPWAFNDLAVLELLRGCPNLVEFFFNPLDQCPVTALFRSLKENCPKVRRLQFSYQFSMHEYGLDPDVWHSEAIFLEHVQCASHLTILDLAFNELTEPISNALVKMHGDSLERLYLRLYEDSGPESLRNLSRVLSSCSRLKSFEMDTAEDNFMDPINGFTLFEHLWSPSLEFLALDGLSTALFPCYGPQGLICKDDDIKADFDGYIQSMRTCDSQDPTMEACDNQDQSMNKAHSHGQFGSRADVIHPKHHWKCHHQDVTSDRRLESQNANLFFRHLLSYARTLPRLKRVKVNDYTYSQKDQDA
ncbi:hypothetical protein BGZ94_009422 [Podila epigama]|nr:hypothetical protein BGZ94_009422 [Podila epigama]